MRLSRGESRTGGHVVRGAHLRAKKAADSQTQLERFEQTLPEHAGTRLYRAAAQIAVRSQVGRIALAERGDPKSPVRRAIARMVARAERVPGDIRGVTAADIFLRYIVGNPKISNTNLLALERLPFDRIACTEEEKARIEAMYPGVRTWPSHHIGVALFHAATGVALDVLSQALPDVGITGPARSWRRGWKPESDGECLTTALHDFTDLLTGLNGLNLNMAVWGYTDSVHSAAASYLGIPARAGSRPRSLSVR